MSVIEEDIVVAPWVGPTTCKNIISVIILSSNPDIIEKLSEAITYVHTKNKYRWKLIILRSLTLEEVLKQSSLTGSVSIDFVVLALDTSKLFCLEWTKRVYDQMHPDLRSRRAVIVNPSGLQINSMAVNPNELLTMQTEMKLDLISGNIYKMDGALYLSQRLLKYIEVTIGTNTGIPNLNI